MRTFYFNFRCFVRNILSIYDSNELVCLTAQSLKKEKCSLAHGVLRHGAFLNISKYTKKKYANLLKPWFAVKSLKKLITLALFFRIVRGGQFPLKVPHML